MYRRTIRILMAYIAMLVLAGVSQSFAQSSFYDATPGQVRGKPGSLIRSEILGTGPWGSTAYRVLYRSTNPKGEPIAVSGVIVVPQQPGARSGRDIVAWAHPTSGVARRCAPSLRPTVLQRIKGLSEMIERGYIVTATDYPGLGTAGVHPYMVGESEGRAVLDSVRAARALSRANAGARYAIWGHSQGGHAALFAGEMARRYLPDLQLTGVATAAPATEIGTLMRADLNEQSGEVLTSFALWSWSQIYGVPLEPVLQDRVRPVFNRIVGECNETLREDLGLWMSEQPFEREGFLKADITAIEPWRALIARNTPGQALAGAPLFIAQGEADTTVRPEITRDFAARLCARRTPLRLVWMPGVDHANAAAQSAGAAVAWIAARFKGEPAPDDCARR